MSVAVLEREVESKEIVCRFYPNRHCPGEGYYRIQTTDGKFLGNVGAEDLDYELSSLRQDGYCLVRIIGGKKVC